MQACVLPSLANAVRCTVFKFVGWASFPNRHRQIFDMAEWRPKSFEGFEFERVLSHDPQSKTICVLGRFDGKDGRAIVRLTRQHFNMETRALSQCLGKDTSLSLTFENDIYSKFTAQLPEPHALVSVDLTHPATERHIQKAEDQPLHMVMETPDLFRSSVLPIIQALPPSRLSWVYNILEKKKETERLIFEDPDASNGFMLHPDLKWDQVTTQQLYCLALCHRKDLPCLRSLTAEHLPLLRNIRAQAAAVVSSKFGVHANELRMFVHYPPSYYHFHVHVTHIKWMGGGTSVGKAHLLDDIIDNIETFGSDFYQKRTLGLVVGENEEMWQQIYSKLSQ